MSEQETLAERKRILSHEEDSRNEVIREDAEQFVVFNLHGQAFGLKIHSVIEIQQIPEITPVFHCPEFVVGVVNIRGNIITLLDIGLFFGLQKTELNSDSKMVILEHGELDAGIVADSMDGARWIDPDSIQPPPPTIKEVSNQWLQGVVQEDTEPLMLLDVEALFESKEIQEL